ncbi:hypothetical protein EXIGLDRAFT_751249, partial [Exidia glandulosa HHB12029]
MRSTKNKSKSTAPLADTTNTVKAAKKAKATTAAVTKKHAAPSASRAPPTVVTYTQEELDARLAEQVAQAAANVAQIEEERRAENADYERRIANLQAVQDNATEQAAADASLDDTIPKPHGSAGDDFNLLDKMQLSGNKLEYDLMHRQLHEYCARVKLSMADTFAAQPGDKMIHLFRKMRDDFPYLRRFTGNWALREMTRVYLKDRRAYEAKLQRTKASKAKAASARMTAAIAHRRNDEDDDNE